MKKITFLIFVVFSLIVGGCTQKAQQTSESNISASSGGIKPETQMKSEFPKKPIEMIVPAPPGGGTDSVARALAKVATKYLPNGQSIVVVNKVGGANTIGVTEVFNSKPDGYKIGLIPSGTITVQPHYGNTPYTHDSFQTMMRVFQFPSFLYVKADSPWKTFEEWLDYTKQNPDKFTYGSAGVSQIPLEILSKEFGIKTKAVPFDGNATVLTALLGGHVQGAILSTLEAKSSQDSGAIRPLIGLSSEKLGDVPLLKEKGFDIEANTYGGVIAPKGLPKDVFNILHDALKKSLEDPEVVDLMKKMGIEPGYRGPEEFQKELTNTFNYYGQYLKKLNMIK